MGYTDEQQLMSLRASIVHLKTKLNEQAASITSLATLEKSQSELTKNTEQLTSDLDAEKHKSEELQQQIADKERTIRSLMAEMQKSKSKLGQPEPFTSFSLLPIPPASTASHRPSKFFPTSRLQFPRFDPIAANLDEQRAQLDRNRAFVAAEWTAHVPSRLDREASQYQAEALKKSHAEGARLKKALSKCRSTVESLNTELDALRTSLSEAQWGVVMAMDKCTHYLNKSQTQRKQLAEVQSANGAVRRKNKRLRAEVKQWRDKMQGWWSEQEMKQGMGDITSMSTPAGYYKGAGMVEQDSDLHTIAGGMCGSTHSIAPSKVGYTDHAGFETPDFSSKTTASVIPCDVASMAPGQQPDSKKANRQQAHKIAAEFAKKVNAMAWMRSVEAANGCNDAQVSQAPLWNSSTTGVS